MKITEKDFDYNYGSYPWGFDIRCVEDLKSDYERGDFPYPYAMTLKLIFTDEKTKELKEELSKLSGINIKAFRTYLPKNVYRCDAEFSILLNNDFSFVIEPNSFELFVDCHRLSDSILEKLHLEEIDFDPIISKIKEKVESLGKDYTFTDILREACLYNKTFDELEDRLSNLIFEAESNKTSNSYISGMQKAFDLISEVPLKEMPQEIDNTPIIRGMNLTLESIDNLIQKKTKEIEGMKEIKEYMEKFKEEYLNSSKKNDIEQSLLDTSKTVKKQSER